MKNTLKAVPNDDFRTTDFKTMEELTGRDCSEWHKLNKPKFEYKPISMWRPGLIKFILERIR